MILPNVFIKALIDLVTTKKSELKIYQAEEGSEDLKLSELKPPYVLFYITTEDFGNLMDDGTATDIPIVINAACVSTMHKTASAALNESMTLAVKLIRLLQKEYTLDNFDGDKEPASLRSKPLPFTIGRISSDISSVICHFNYLIPIVKEL